jgi:Nucleotide-diphospho-sugar transferase
MVPCDCSTVLPHSAQPPEENGAVQQGSSAAAAAAAAAAALSASATTSGRRTTASQQEAANHNNNAVLLGSEEDSLLPESVRDLFSGLATVPRAHFIEQFDIGVPWNENRPGSSDVLLFYSDPSSLPTDYNDNDDNDSNDSNPMDGSSSSSSSSRSRRMRSYASASAADATANCDHVKVVLTQPSVERQCLAVVAQWESYHVHNFLRLREDDDDDDDATAKKSTPRYSPSYPLRNVSRRHTLKGKRPQMPLPYQTRAYWPLLIDYLQKLDGTLDRLAPLAREAAGSDNTVVVMVCNFGQSELLFNFACSARARGLDLAKVLVFATDADSYELALSLGIRAFDVQDAFGTMPSRAARVYGDKAFQGMMMSKAYCVHLVNALQYDVLFQDVDVTWYQDPIEYFHSPEAGKFDFYFQDGTEFFGVLFQVDLHNEKPDSFPLVSLDHPSQTGLTRIAMHPTLPTVDFTM